MQWSRVGEQEAWAAMAAVKNIGFDSGPHPEGNWTSQPLLCLSSPGWMAEVTCLSPEQTELTCCSRVCRLVGDHSPQIFLRLWFPLGRWGCRWRLMVQQLMLTPFHYSESCSHREGGRIAPQGRQFCMGIPKVLPSSFSFLRQAVWNMRVSLRLSQILLNCLHIGFLIKTILSHPESACFMGEA